jgi:GNAT superfamily N-acetyltransferase
VGARPGIRRGEPGDRDAVLALWLALIEHHRRLDRDYPDLPGVSGALEREIDLALEGTSSRIYLGVDDGRAVGFVSAEIADEPDGSVPLGTIHELYVVPERRGAGLGRALVDAAEEWFGARAVGRRRVRVETSNRDALRFWRAVGYTEDAAPDDRSEPRARILLRRA